MLDLYPIAALGPVVLTAFAVAGLVILCLIGALTDANEHRRELIARLFAARQEINNHRAAADERRRKLAEYGRKGALVANAKRKAA